MCEKCDKERNRRMPSAKDKEKGAFHKASGRHVLVIEADRSEENKRFRKESA